MFSHALCLFLLLSTFPNTLTATSEAYTATDFILLNCGEPSNTLDHSNRSWNSDESSSYAPPNAVSQSFPASNMHPSVFPVPYSRARVFQSPFTYTFPVLTGPKFVRLYFYPDTYSTFDTSQSFFSLTANNNDFILLSNFSAYLNSPSLTDQPSFMKELIINVEENQILSLTFFPNPNSFAFINGIEIVSIPDKLYFKGDQVPITSGGQLYFLKNDTAMEMLYRLNIGGTYVQIQDDSGSTRGMFRAWAQDDEYILRSNFGYTPYEWNLTIDYTAETPRYSAPQAVYRTSRVISNGRKSLDWGFPVDSGFHYLLRFHFCEIQLTKPNQRVFDILIDNKTMEVEADVISWTDGRGIPIYKDYVAFVPNNSHLGKKYMLLSLVPNEEGNPKYFNALLNGLEIFKLSGDDGSLAAANPGINISSLPTNSTIAVEGGMNKNRRVSSHVITYTAASTGGVIGVLTMIVASVLLISLWRRRKVKDSVTMTAVGKSLSSNQCRYFSLDEIKTATGNFDSNLVIGKGGFGNVYKGFIDNGTTTVAIKRLNPSSNQGVHEFLTEIEMLSRLRHLHLVSLIGYSDDKGEMILVYDYMSNGTLRDHLYNSNNLPLSWKQRLQICMGSARGLHYLHISGAKQAIIHRDVKSTNILLDDKWVAKVSDFGLSKVGPTEGADTHVTTVVKGSFGYVDPEYYRRQQLTDKSDVYSFGVVLFEVICARPAINQNLPEEQVNLADWAKFCYRNGMINQIVDSNLDGQIAPECLGEFVETAVTCLSDKGIKRPSMSNIVWSLELAMQLQEAAEHRDCNGDDVLATRPSLPLLRDLELTITTHEDMDMFSGTSEPVSEYVSTTGSDNLKSADVFSELMNPTGR